MKTNLAKQMTASALVAVLTVTPVSPALHAAEQTHDNSEQVTTERGRSDSSETRRELDQAQLNSVSHFERPQGRLSEDELKRYLIDLKQWSGFYDHELYFNLLASKRALRTEIAYLRDRLGNGRSAVHYPYVTDKPVHLLPAIGVTIPKALDTNGTGLVEDFGSNFKDPSDALCVTLSGLGDIVPVQVAELFAASWQQGFVTRIVAGVLYRSWYESGAIESMPKLELPLERLDDQAMQLKEFLKKDNYPNGDFKKHIGRLLQQNSMQASGILMGWKAADELEKLHGTKDPRVYEAGTALAAGRFTAEEQGRIAAFSLNYLNGLTRVMAFKRMVDSTGRIPSDPNLLKETMKKNRIEEQHAIMAEYAKDPGVKESAGLLDGLFTALLAEFSAVSRNKELQGRTKDLLIADYFDFLRGWQQGSSAAADAVFKEVFFLGYGLGYDDGFIDGFAQGFATGFRDGFASGYAKAWEEANRIIDGLKRQVADLTAQNARLSESLASTEKEKSNLRSELDQVAQRMGGRSKLDNWLGKATSVARAVGSVVGAIRKFKFW